MPKDLHPYSVLLRPVLTEKTTGLTDLRKYVFAVDPRANKLQITEAVEVGFQVVVDKVNIMTVRGKTRRIGRTRGQEPDWKKAVVTLAPGYEIRLFEGV